MTRMQAANGSIRNGVRRLPSVPRLGQRVRLAAVSGVQRGRTLQTFADCRGRGERESKDASAASAGANVGSSCNVDV